MTFSCVTNREQVVGRLGRKGTACGHGPHRIPGALVAASPCSMSRRRPRSWVGNQFCDARLFKGGGR